MSALIKILRHSLKSFMNYLSQIAYDVMITITLLSLYSMYAQITELTQGHVVSYITPYWLAQRSPSLPAHMSVISTEDTLHSDSAFWEYTNAVTAATSQRHHIDAFR